MNSKTVVVALSATLAIVLIIGLAVYFVLRSDSDPFMDIAENAPVEAALENPGPEPEPAPEIEV